jgi:hypothetical protein
MKRVPTSMDGSGFVSDFLDPPPEATRPQVMKQYKHSECRTVSDMFKVPGTVQSKVSREDAERDTQVQMRGSCR